MLEKILGTSEKVGAISCANKEEFLEIAAGNSFLDGLFTFFRKEDVKKWQKIFREVFPALKEELAFSAMTGLAGFILWIPLQTM